jgi:SAM-dependent methyltransferase
MTFNLNAFGHKSQLKKFSKGRKRIKDLYPSEKKFFLKLAKNSKTFLDFGCATGNFINILKNISSIKNYTGLDISNDMLNFARLLHPKYKFEKFNGKKILLKSRYELVYSFGTLIYCLNYKNLIKDFINLSEKYINFDVRLIFDKTMKKKVDSYQIIAKKPLLRLPYVIIDFNEFLEFILKISKYKYKIDIYGYEHTVSSDVRTKNKKVIMTSVLIDKTKSFSLNIEIKK